jgi:hypothetical protein
MNQKRLASSKVYMTKEAHTILNMLKSEGSRELALAILNTSKRRFAEDDRRALYRELHFLKESLKVNRWTWGYLNANNNWLYPTTNPQYTEEDQAILDQVRITEWRHSKRSYNTEEWEKNNRKKEYRRSAKNHYS